MAKIKTHQDSYVLGNWSNWEYNKERKNSWGISYTRQGLIILYHRAKDKRGNGVDYARASIIHRGRVYSLATNDKVTKLGWLRIANKWAKNIWKIM